jgi:hypothetical protein
MPPADDFSDSDDVDYDTDDVDGDVRETITFKNGC